MPFRSTKWLVAFVLAFCMLKTSALAHTAEQEQMCAGDAMRPCGEFIPNVDRITACMIQKYSQLSHGCKSVFAGLTADHALPRRTPLGRRM